MEEIQKNIVAKFGGTSMTDFPQVKDIIIDNPKITVIVVSAPGKRSSDDVKVTDRLKKICQLRSLNEYWHDEWKEVCHRFIEIANEFELNRQLLDAEFVEIKNQIKAGCSEAYILSRGEYLTAKLFARYLKSWDFVDAYELVDIGKDGNPSLQRQIKVDIPVVVPGFYGKGVTGELVILPRGGSDVTAAYLAAQLKYEFERWSDSAVCVTNPKIIHGARVVDEMTYTELGNISSIVQDILHPTAAKICTRYNVTTRIRNINDATGEFTTIVTHRKSEETPIVGINVLGGYVSFTLFQPGIDNAVGILATMAEIFADKGIPVRTVGGGGASVVFMTHKSNLQGFPIEDMANIIRNHHRFDNHKVFTNENLALISIAGDGMVGNYGYLAGVTGAIERKKLSILAIESPSGEGVIELFIDQAASKDAVEALYVEFISNEL